MVRPAMMSAARLGLCALAAMIALGSLLFICLGSASLPSVPFFLSGLFSVAVIAWVARDAWRSRAR